MGRKILITGCAGFIGFHVALKLKAQGDEVLGLDNFNDYYDVSLKRARQNILKQQQVLILEKDINDFPHLIKTVETFKPTHFLHLAAQAGIHYSLTNPNAYIEANVKGFLTVLETLKNFNSVALIYASTSSVYGLNQSLPYSILERTDAQASFYGVTKKMNELMAANYHYLYGIKTLGLRYFTVYGPWGRPDMALFKFTKAILNGEIIELFNFGKMQRDFTYIDEIVKGTIAALDYKGSTPIFNLGNHHLVALEDFVTILEKVLKKKALKKYLPLQKADVLATYADIRESQKELNFYPNTSLEEGLEKFVSWYKNYYQIE